MSVNTTSSPHEIPAEIRQVIVRQLGAALASAWRARHAGTNESPRALGTRRAESITGTSYDRSISKDTTPETAR
jgi:hypothetical protein